MCEVRVFRVHTIARQPHEIQQAASMRLKDMQQALQPHVPDLLSEINFSKIREDLSELTPKLRWCAGRFYGPG
jgi:hypothetical protein